MVVRSLYTFYKRANSLCFIVIIIMHQNLNWHLFEFWYLFELNYHIRAWRGASFGIPKGGLRISWWSQSSFWWTHFQVCRTGGVDHFWGIDSTSFNFLIDRKVLFDGHIFRSRDDNDHCVFGAAGVVQMGPKGEIKNWPPQFYSVDRKGYSR